MLACAVANAAEPEAVMVKLPLPWQQGDVLHYRHEQVQTKTGPGTREKSRSSSTIEVKTVGAGTPGFLQLWRGYDSTQDTLEGDKVQAQAMADAMKGLEDLSFEIEMDAEGTYQRMRNLDIVVRRMRAALQPVVAKLVRDATEKAAAGLEPAKRAQALQQAQANADAYLDRITAPAVLEGMLTRDIQTVLNFAGAELEDDQAYELETTLDNPTGGAPFPAKLSFGLYVVKDAPEDVNLEWTLEIDPVKGASAIWDTVERLYGRRIGEAERKTLPAQVSIVDTGFIVFERATGLPEMYQYERNVKIAENANYERSRLRLVEQAHDHAWTEENPQDTEPALTGDERDAQLCADAGADLVAAIAACSRVLERPGLEPQARARWHAARAGHRGRMQQHAQALADFDKAVALQPGNVAHRLGRAGAHGLLGNHAAALTDAEQTAVAEPTSALAQLLIGSAHEGMQDYARAEAAFARAIELAPNEARGYDARCWTRAMRGDLAGAQADCDRALALDGKSYNSLNSRGYVHYRAGRHAAAVADYDAAIAAQPGVASSWYVRGLARRALGDAKGAEADLEKALAIDPKVAERYAGYGVK